MEKEKKQLLFVLRNGVEVGRCSILDLISKENGFLSLLLALSQKDRTGFSSVLTGTVNPTKCY